MTGGRGRLRVATALAALLPLLGLVGPTAAAAEDPVRLDWASGGFSGHGHAASLQFGAWRGAASQVATQFLPAETWASLTNPLWHLADAQGQPATLRNVYSLQPWPHTGGSLAEAATGAYDEHFAALGRNLVAGGQGGATIRLAWEANGDWYPWSVTDADDAATFVQAWRRIVTALRSAQGQAFRFDWNLHAQDAGIDPALTYPGDAYVDTVGLDVYDTAGRPGRSSSQRFADLVRSRVGLAWQRDFAAAHGKQTSFAEWGLVHDEQDPALGGNDDPLFVRSMVVWFAANPPAFESYFDVDTPTGLLFGLSTDRATFPRAAAEYRRLSQAREAGELARALALPTTTTVGLPALGVVGDPVVLRATVSGGALNGHVQFRSGTTPLGPPVPVLDGRAALTTRALAAGTHAVSAAYSHGTGAAASTSPQRALRVADPRGARVLLTPLRAAVPRGGTLDVALRARTADGRALPGARLVVQARPAGRTAFRAIRDLRADASGLARTTFRPRSSAAWRVLWLDASGRARAVSAEGLVVLR